MLDKNFYLPVRIAIKEGDIENTESLLKEKIAQIGLAENDVTVVKGKSRLVIDFGEELCGGVRILMHYINNGEPIRIRFGESLTESITPLGEKNATNDHSPRDFLLDIPQLSDGRYGQTGFRFVCLEFSGGEYRIKSIIAENECDIYETKGSFECSDARINDIYAVARKTLFLCLQRGMIWDGIKRDRLVWIGDLHPETLGLLYTTGDIKNIENCLDFATKETLPTDWMNGLASYSFWWIIILYDYYRFTGKTDILNKHADYLYRLIENIEQHIDENGLTCFPSNFLDWPTDSTEDAVEGVASLCKMACERAVELLKTVQKDVAKAELSIKKISKRAKIPLTAKQAIAMRYLANGEDDENVGRLLIQGGAKGLSTFMSYYILQSVKQCCGVKNALAMLKEYYGGMLDKGATTFWEDFDIDHINDSGRIDEIPEKGKKDIHGDYGNYCYKGFRHSLCHGWACGPIQFLTECILGLNVTEIGFKKVTIAPALGELKYAKGRIPTPYGTMYITHTVTEKGIKTEIITPKEIEVTVIGYDYEIKRR